MAQHVEDVRSCVTDLHSNCIMNNATLLIRESPANDFDARETNRHARRAKSIKDALQLRASQPTIPICRLTGSAGERFSERRCCAGWEV